LKGKQSLAKARAKLEAKKENSSNSGFTKQTSSKTLGELIKNNPKHQPKTKSSKGGGGSATTTVSKPLAIKQTVASKPSSQQQQQLKQQAAKQIIQPKMVSQNVDLKTGLTKNVAQISTSQFIRSNQVKRLSNQIQLNSKPQSSTGRNRDNKRSTGFSQPSLTISGKPQLFSKTTIVDGSIKAINIGGNLQDKAKKTFSIGGNVPLFDIRKKFPRATPYISAVGVGAVTVLATRNLPPNLLTSTSFKAAERGVGASFVGSKVQEYSVTRSKTKFALKTGGELLSFGVGGLSTRIKPKAIKNYGGVKLEQFRTNLALEVDGGKLVTKGFFKAANIGTAKVTGDVLFGAKAKFKRVDNPLGSFESSSYKPIKETVTVKINPRKPPLPNDFLFKGSVKDVGVLSQLSSPKQGVGKTRVLMEKTSAISGYGFGNKLDLALTPFRSFKVSKGTGLKNTRAFQREIDLEFGSTKLSRGQSVVPTQKYRGFKTKFNQPTKKQIGFKAKEIEVFKFGADTEGTLLFTKRGRLFAPKGVKLKESSGRTGGFFDLTPQQKVKQFPFVARKVKLTPKKTPKDINKVEIFVPLSTGGQRQQQQQYQKLATLDVSETKQQSKTLSKSKTKTVTSSKTKQTLNQVLRSKQSQKGILRTKQFSKQKTQQKSKQKLSQSLSQVPKLNQSQSLSQVPKLNQSQSLSQVPKLNQAQKLRQNQLLKQNLALKPKQQLLQTQSSPYPSFQRVTGRGKRGRKGKIPKFKFPKLSRKNSKGSNKLNRVLKYQPSLVAVEGKIRGKKRKDISGLEVRPLNY